VFAILAVVYRIRSFAVNALCLFICLFCLFLCSCFCLFVSKIRDKVPDVQELYLGIVLSLQKCLNPPMDTQLVCNVTNMGVYCLDRELLRFGFNISVPPLMLLALPLVLKIVRHSVTCCCVTVCLQALLSSTSHIDKGYGYRFMWPWLGSGLLTSTGKVTEPLSATVSNDCVTITIFIVLVSFLLYPLVTVLDSEGSLTSYIPGCNVVWSRRWRPQAPPKHRSVFSDKD
jgi:hypothetical protein